MYSRQLNEGKDINRHIFVLPWWVVFLHLWIFAWVVSGPSWSPPPPWPSSSPAPRNAESSAEDAWPFCLNAPAHKGFIESKIIVTTKLEIAIKYIHVWWFYRHKHQYNSGTLNISLPTSPSSLICDSSVSRVIHCSLYISARRWACFRSSCNAWWNRVTQTGSLKNCNKHPKTKRDLILYIMGRWFFSVFHNTDFFKTTSIYMFFCFR